MEALARLQNVVRRVAEPWRPASSAEAYHIVRQRLFVEPDAAALASIRDTARKFVEMYRSSPSDFPVESRSAAYEERIRHTYPIHPELFDRLYEDWSSLERFQRTRGVLRLMNAVVHALWVGEDAGPLILPGSLPLATADVNSEIAQYLPDSWKAVIDADVDGAQSEPARIDVAKPQLGQRSLTKRLARTVFFGAVPTLGSAHKGVETQRVFLGTAVPGDRTGDFHAALNALADRATYYYTGQGKYWYDLQANITRSAKDHAERLHLEDVWAEIIRRLDEHVRTRGDFASVHVAPETDADVPDVDEARLVVLHPKVSHKSRRGQQPQSDAVELARHTLEKRGTGHRTHRNMLVFLAADTDRLERAGERRPGLPGVVARPRHAGPRPDRQPEGPGTGPPQACRRDRRIEAGSRLPVGALPGAGRPKAAGPDRRDPGGQPEARARGAGLRAPGQRWRAGQAARDGRGADGHRPGAEHLGRRPRGRR